MRGAHGIVHVLCGTGDSEMDDNKTLLETNI